MHDSPLTPALRRRLQRLGRGAARQQAPLLEYTTWRMGGPAALLLEPGGSEELAAVLACCVQESIPRLLLAGGSNLLCDDQGLGGVALRLAPRGDLGRMERCGRRIHAGAGCSMQQLARFAAEQGLSGLEHAANIPGSLGGLVAMNGGSMRRAISEHLVQVHALTPAGELTTFSPDACGFGYRCSVFQENGCIVTGAVLELQPDEPAAVLARIEADLAERGRKFPLELPSCGSVFKSHEALYERFGPPGKVIEETGCKGLRCGDVQVSRRHANFFVNRGKGRAADALELIQRVRQAVRERTGVAMECEVRFATHEGRVAPAHTFSAG